MNKDNPWASPDGQPVTADSLGASGSTDTHANDGTSGNQSADTAAVTPHENQAAPAVPETPAQPATDRNQSGAQYSNQGFASAPTPTGVEATSSANSPVAASQNPEQNPAGFQNPSPAQSAPAEMAPHANTTASAPQTTVKPQTQAGAQSVSQAGTQSASQAGAQYGANQFWGQPGFNDPLANQGQPLQTSATWGGAADPRAVRRGPGWLGAIGIAVAASLITTGGFYAVTSNLPAKAEASKSTLFNPEDKGVSTPAPVANSTSQNPDWESVAKAVRPAVVAIMVRAGNKGDQGSGAIIDSNGHILTNNHVVASAADGNGRITVELHDGRLYKAEIVGRDVLTDLAVIKIVKPPKDLTVVALGDSSKLRVGEAVAAIGNPLGLSSTVTTGIVSALDRPVRVDAVQGGNGDDDSGPNLQDLFGGDIGGLGGLGGLGGGRSGSDDGFIRPQPRGNDKVTTNAIQVDAAVNPGNSGGPLFDAKGRVIGVTSSIASLSGGGLGGGQAGSIGLGFAIPINQAQMIASQLIEHGEAVHAALGVIVSEDVATVDEVSRLGAKVQDISPDGAARKAGMKNGDIIVGIDGKQVKGSESLVGWVRQHAVGDTVDLQIVRDGKEMKVSVTLQAQ